MTDASGNLPPELLKLGLNQLLSLLKVTGGKLAHAIGARIKKLIASKTLLISLSEEETRKIYEITKQDLYIRLNNCLVSHWSMNLIALGIYVSKLNELDQRHIVERVRSEVHSKYQARGVKILNMGSTGAIGHIIEYLSDLKMQKNYGFIEMGKFFDKIIEKWEDIAFFVKSEYEIGLVKKKCLEFIGKKYPLFFIFAYASAIPATINAIAELSNSKQLSGYIWDAKMKPEGFKEAYSCYFQSIEGDGIEIFA